MPLVRIHPYHVMPQIIYFSIVRTAFKNCMYTSLIIVLGEEENCGSVMVMGSPVFGSIAAGFDIL